MNGRNKGKNGEREVAKLVTPWWRQLEPTAEFASTPQSGGWATPKLRGAFKVAGDLVTTAEQWPWTVEVKRREQWSLERLLAGRSSPVWKWWLQTQKAAQEESREPQLWFRQNRRDWMLMMPETAGALFPALHTFKFLGEVNYGQHYPAIFSWDSVKQAKPEEIARYLR